MARYEPNPDAEDEPLDADLIAYLDGELEGHAAKDVEDRLAQDTALRAKAEAYKKTYDLLDYLPRPEPSPDFATRTITKLQPVLGGSAPAQAAEQVVAGLPNLPPSNPSVTVLGSGQMPAARRGWGWKVLLACLALIAATGGYFGHMALRPFLEPVKQLNLDDISIIENLPLYLGVDDLDYARDLDTPELFGLDSLNLVNVDYVRPEMSQHTRDKLTELFKSFPTARQDQLRTLHQDLNKLPQDQRSSLYRVLENYAVWLDRLQDNERKEIFSQPNEAARLQAVQQLKERTWRAGLSNKFREQLKSVANDEERQNLIANLKATEKLRRGEWKLARQQRETPLGPFEDPKAPKKPNAVFIKDVELFLKQTLAVDQSMLTDVKLELLPSCRLSREELYDLRTRYEAATKDGEWFNFGLMVYRLTEKHPYLPEYGKKPTIIDYNTAMREFGKEIKPKGLLNALEKLEKRPAGNRGKWPDFALEIAELARRNPVGLPPTLEWLGPCRPGQFNDSVNLFIEKTLLPKLSETEKVTLKSLEGKWPDYPRQLIQYAKTKDESMPGVMLPGKPSTWAKFYTIPAVK